MAIAKSGRVASNSGTGRPLRNAGSPAAVAAVNEVQTITGTATGGTGTLTFGGQSTAALAFNASAATIQTALRGLSSIGGTNVTCTGGPLGTAGVVCTFSGTLAATDVGAITVGAGFTGGTVTVAESTKGVAAVPVAFAGFAAVGGLLIDTTNALLYQNTGTVAAPTWTKVGTES